MDSRVAEKVFCGLPLQKACVVVGGSNLIVAVIWAISSLMGFAEHIFLAIPLTMIEILLVTTMIVGAIKQNLRLMQPYVVAKIVLVIGSAVIYVSYLIFYYGMLLHYHIGRNVESGMEFFYVFALIGGKCVHFFALNIIPVLVVGKYVMDLKEEKTREASSGVELEQAGSEENVSLNRPNEIRNHKDI